MNDAQIWTIIGALYALPAGGYLIVRRLDRIFDRVGEPNRPRSGDQPPETDPAARATRASSRREDG